MDDKTKFKTNPTVANKLLELWKVGVPPSEALQKFGDADLVAELRQSREQRTDQDRLADMVVACRNSGLRFPSSEEVSRHGLQRLARQKNALAALEWDIEARVESGELIAIGFLDPAQSNLGTPIEVQPHVLHSRPGWSLSDHIEGNGLRYESVRFVRADAVQNFTRKAGRPSRQAGIFRAWEQMESEGAIDTSKSLSWHFPDLCRRVKKFDHDQSDTGLEDKTLYDLLGPRFRELKERR
jgi:hypothetical protein